MEYLAEFISADGLSKKEFIAELKPVLYRVATPTIYYANLQKETLNISNDTVQKREYALWDKYLLSPNIVFCQYKEVI